MRCAVDYLPRGRAEANPLVVATYASKDRVFPRMKTPRLGPGSMHLPDWVTDEYLEQLTGEKKITVRDKRTRTKPVPSGLSEGKVLCVKTYSRLVPSALARETRPWT